MKRRVLPRCLRRCRIAFDNWEPDVQAFPLLAKIITIWYGMVLDVDATSQITPSNLGASCKQSQTGQPSSAVWLQLSSRLNKMVKQHVYSREGMFVSVGNAITLHDDNVNMRRN